ncbi:MAG: zinc-ribbon domain-containing protein, partial [Clostridia bacterium]|nr:zinc-ribbon domain-containing protein [Clostridia bacterium]
CGRWVMDALYNADALECVACAVWENTPEYCKHCGTKVVLSDSICPKCGERLLYGGSFNEQFT